MAKKAILMLSTAFTILFASGVVLVTAEKPAQAAFPGTNGKIAFTSDQDGNYEIYTMNPDGSNMTRLTNNAGLDRMASFSPDGNRIAFASDKDGIYEIYVMDADGTDQTRLTHNSMWDIQPSWSPDGEKIAFTSERDGNHEIYTMNADGSDQVNISQNPAVDFEPNWGPGDKIAFTTNRESAQYAISDVFTMNSDGSNPTNVTRTGRETPAHNPDWSPDGSQIAYTGSENGDSRIFTMNADGSNQLKVVQTISQSPAWSPDGAKIAFTNYLNGTHYAAGTPEIYTMNADGSGQTNLTDNVATAFESDWQPLNTSPPPDTTINSGPDAPVSSTSASFSFSSSKPDSTFQCSLDGSEFAACPSPVSYSGLSQGSHTLQVIAIDALGNADATPASSTWLVDTVAPSGTIKINGVDTRTTSPGVRLDLSASDPAPASEVEHMRFKNEGKKATWSGWFDYKTSESWTLTTGAGKKTVYVQYEDRAHNVSAIASDSINYIKP